MKTMTCCQLGGACDLEFKAKTFEEMAALSRAHGKNMFKKQDAAHLAAMAEAMQEWFDAKRQEFANLPED